MNIISHLPRLLLPGLAAALLVPALLLAVPPRQNTESSEGQWAFSLLPRAFQQNPLVDQTVVTELTEEGRKLPPPSAARPVYYVAQAGALRTEGHGAGEKSPPQAAELSAALQRALATNGYQPATPEHPPTLLIVYHWGLHSNLDAGSGEIEGTATPDIGHRNLLSRAALVGGTKFAQELREVLEKQAREDEAKRGLPPDIAAMFPDLGPLRMFTERNLKNRQLYEDARGDCYFVIASAYDYAAGARGERRLLWRTKMTSDATGVAMRDSLPGLILNAGKYLGVDMPEAATLLKRVQRDTQVILGPLEVEEYLEPKATPPAPDKTKP